jgi:hypothetical protein
MADEGHDYEGGVHQRVGQREEQAIEDAKPEIAAGHGSQSRNPALPEKPGFRKRYSVMGGV